MNTGIDASTDALWGGLTVDPVRDVDEIHEQHEPATEPLSRCAPAELPRQLAQLMRQELPNVSEEIVDAVYAEVPVYARPPESDYGHALQVGVDEAIGAFVEEVADPAVAHDRLCEVMRKLGEGEWREGRTLTDLRNAFRVGGRVAWRHIVTVGARHDLAREVFVSLADMLFVYLDELAAISQEGYLRARRGSLEDVGGARRRLLRLIADSSQDSHGLVRQLSDLVGWTVPDDVSVVAVELGGDSTDVLDGTDVLVDTGADGTRLLLPGNPTPEREALLAAALPNARIAIGPGVPLGNAPDSARWARRALAMAESGMLHVGRVIRCEENLLYLLLVADEELLDLLAARQLSAFATMSTGQRKALLDTMTVALQSKGTAAQIGERLGVHAQTVRYRLRKVESLLGSRMRDPEARFALELVTRAVGLREKKTGTGNAERDGSPPESDVTPTFVTGFL